MRIKKKKLLEFVLTLAIFAFISVAANLFHGSVNLTGNAIIEADGSLQESVQKIAREEAFDTFPAGSKICMNIIMEDNTTRSFKLRKIGDVLNVEKSDLNCDGTLAEDFIITFLDTATFYQFRKENNLEFFFKSGMSGKFKVEESKFVRTGGLLVCEKEFSDKYCGIAMDDFSKYQRRRLGISCCEPNTESPSILKSKPIVTIVDLLSKYLWLIIVVIVTAAIGIGSIFFLGSDKDENDETNANEEKEFKDAAAYVMQLRKQGFDEENIREQLKKSDWDEDDIEYVYSIVRNEDLKSLEERFTRA